MYAKVKLKAFIGGEKLLPLGVTNQFIPHIYKHLNTMSSLSFIFFFLATQV